MATQKNKVEWQFLLDQRDLERGLKKSQRGFQQTTKESSTLGKGLGTLKTAFLGLGLALGAREVLQFAGDAVQLAVAAEEVDARFQAVFGSATDFRQALEEWGDIAGVTKTSAEDLASSFGNLAQTQGLSADESAEFALKTAQLAGDIASFKDLDPEAVFLALNKGLLTTEKEGLKAFDLAISAAEVDTRALTIATKDGREEITKADKAYASYELAVEQAGKAIGDLEATQDSAANQQRQLTASVEEMKEEIGRELLPVYQDLLQLTVQVAPLMANAAAAVRVMTGDLGKFTEGLTEATTEGATFDERMDGAKAAIVSLGKSILRFNPITGSTVILLEQMNNEASGLKTSLGKAADGVKGLTTAQLQSRDQYIAYARGMIDAANATETLERKAFDADRIIKIFSGDLFAAARQAQAFRRSASESLGSLFAGGSGSGQTGFATGGTVPGPRGAPRLIQAHGGEQVISNHGTGGTGGGGGGTVININVTALDPDAAAVAVADAIRTYRDRYGPI